MTFIPLILTSLLAGAGEPVHPATEDLGNGFAHHGVATPVSNHRGTVATVDGQGRNVALVWLFDHTGGYALLMISADTGESEQFPPPFDPEGDCPYSSILSTGNKYYTHFANHFCEFDPVEGAFTFFRKTSPQMAMSMTEDDNGLIWSVTYPQSGVVSFDPETREFKDYGHVYKQDWVQYPRAVAVDDASWVYFGVGFTASQIVAFDPRSGEARPILSEAERAKGSGYVYRDMDGKVYGQVVRDDAADWYEFYRGEDRKIGKHEQINPKPVITGTQKLFHRRFPDGRRVAECDLVKRELVVEDPETGQSKSVRFDYTSEGARVMGVAAAPDDTICGGTMFPMRFFSYNPRTDRWTNRDAYSQWNTVARQGDCFFVGGYPGGFLLEWDPAREWVTTEKGNNDSNPLFLTQCKPTINRPHELLACPDGKTLVLAGTPDYGYTGGGLLIWDRETRSGRLIEHTAVIPEHSTMCLVALPGGKLLGGTTTTPGTGGEMKAENSELYIMDIATGKLEWHGAVLPDVHGYTDMCLGPTGLVYGFADRARFFVFNPAERKVVHEENTQDRFGLTAMHQGPRVFVVGREGAIYVLFHKGIARLDPAAFEIKLLAESPVPIGQGGAYLHGRIYFCTTSHVYSWAVPE